MIIIDNNTNFNSDIPESVAQTVSITKRTAAIEEQGIRLRLTVVDTPGFGDALDNRDRCAAL